MTKEQEEAIEDLECISKYGLSCIVTEEHQEAIKTVLNLLQEKDKQLKRQSCTNKKILKKLQGYRKLVKLKDKHLEQKDKIIEELEEEISLIKTYYDVSDLDKIVKDDR